MEQGRKMRRKKRKRRNLKIKLIIFLIFAICIACASIKCSMLTSRNGPMITEVGGIKVVNDILPEGVLGRPAEERKIMYVVIHETGNKGKGADAASHNSYIHKESQVQQLSWHYSVDDHEIYQHLPDNENAFHAGDKMIARGGNKNGIGVELCVNSDGDYEQTLRNGAKLTAYLLKTYHLDITDVKKHQDFSGKICPERLIKEDRWEDFLSMVKEEKF